MTKNKSMQGNKIGFFAFIIVFIFLIVNTALGADWVEPSVDPPGGNVQPPINQGDTNQYKIGGLTIGTSIINEDNVFYVSGKSLFSGDVSMDMYDTNMYMTNGVNLIVSQGQVYVESSQGGAQSIVAAISGESTNPAYPTVGIYGYENASIVTNAIAVYGYSKNNLAMMGYSPAGTGVYGKSTAGAGVWGDSPILAGRFDGPVVFHTYGDLHGSGITIENGRIKNVPTPGEGRDYDNDAVPKSYVDAQIAENGDTLWVKDTSGALADILRPAVSPSGLLIPAMQRNGVLDIETKVGIGTNDPNANLHIYSYNSNGNLDNAEIDLQSRNDGTYWGIYNNRTDNTLRFWRGNDVLTVSNSSNLQFFQSSVGSGTVTTNQTVNLVGSLTRFSNTFKVGDTITVSGETVRTITAITDDTHLTVNTAFSTRNSGLTYSLVGGDRLVVKGNGNVGIGLTSPTALLNLKAGTATAGTAPLKFTTGTNMTTPEPGAVEWDGTRLYITNASARQTLAYMSDAGSSHNPITLGPIGNGTNANATGMTLNTQVLNLEPASASFGGVVTTDTQTLAGAKTFSSNLTISGNNLIMDTDKSIVVNSATANTTLYLGNYTGGATTFQWETTANKSASLVVEGNVKANKLCIEDDCKAAWSEIAGGGQWTTSGTNIYNANSGNVGIGTGAIAPTNKLTVSGGDILIDHGKGLKSKTSSSAEKYVISSSGGAINSVDIGDTSGWTDGIRFFPGTAQPQMTITNTGNVGIGTITPNAKLHVNGGTSNVTTRIDTTNADPNITLTTIGQRDWSMGVDYSDSGKLKFDTTMAVGGNTKLTIDANTGNVGIGTTEPGASKLNVSGDALVSGALTVMGNIHLTGGDLIGDGGTNIVAGVGELTNLKINPATCSSGCYHSNQGTVRNCATYVPAVGNPPFPPYEPPYYYNPVLQICVCSAKLDSTCSWKRIKLESL